MSGPASEITSYLFVGGSSAAQDEADLASRRITHVGEARAVAQQLHSVCLCLCLCLCLYPPVYQSSIFCARQCTGHRQEVFCARLTRSFQHCPQSTPL